MRKQRPRWPWWVITLVVVTVPTAAVTLCVVGLVLFADGDDGEFIDQGGLLDAASAGCADVVRTLEASPGDVAAGNAAIERLVAGVEALGPDAIGEDYPTEDWLLDWHDLEAARAATVAGAVLVVPRTDDDDPITARMIDVAPESCTRAVQLAAF